MLLERNQVLIGVVMSLVLGAGTVFAVFLSGGLISRGMTLTADFTDAAGLQERDFVFVAGVQSGQVQSVEIDGETVRVAFSLTAPEIPADSTASIIISNTLGKRAIRLQPGSSSETFDAGDHIPLDRTTTPVDLPELGDESAELLGTLDVDALNGVTEALADITEGQREEVAQLLDGVQRLSRVIADKRTELETVLDTAEEFVDAAADKDRELVRIIDGFGTTLDTLAQRRVEVTELLEETASATDLTADIFEERRAQIDRMLFELHEDLEIVDRHQVDLAHMLAYAGVAVHGFATIGYEDGQQVRRDTPEWGNVFVTDMGAIGIEALLACNGALDNLLTELIGPSPECDERRPGNPPNPDDGDATSASTAAAGDGPEVPPDRSESLYRGLDGFFSGGGGHR